MKRMPGWVWVVVLVVAVWALTSGTDSDDRVPERAGSPSGATGQVADDSTHRTDRSDPPDQREPRRRRDDRDSPRHDPAPGTGSHAPRTYLVVHVVDGDTLDLGNGERVRLVGIDTPEVGECGYEAASVALSRMVLDQEVRLTVSDEDRDRYGRLLRYVDVGRTDAGLELIRKGLAIARYDSRDGYGFHPREPAYVAADRGSRPTCARPVPLAAPVAPASGNGCAPGYTPCVPPGPPDLDCADLDGPIRVTGSDPHRLDGNGDGWGCE